ncbi:MAG: SurA N-terminal domain-containing protein [Rhizobiaceae bacterium]
MLEALRSFVTGWVAKLLLILLVGSFALWGVSGSILGGADATTVATVGETKVSANTFIGVYNRALGETQQQMGRRLTRDQARIFGVEGRALGQLVSWATLDEFARRNALSLSDDTLARMIADNPAFHDSSGKFNRDLFRRATAEAQMREGDFITLQNASAVRNQLTEAFATGPVLPKVFENALTQYTEEERSFSYLIVTPDIAGKPTAPGESELKTYFEANKATYKAPEYRKLAVLALEPKDIADEAAVSDEEIARDYEDRKASYAKPEQRRVQQIVFKTQEKAGEAVESLQAGGVFEGVLADNNITVSDADLGLQSKDKLPKAIADQAFTLPLNEASKIIKGPFGPTMIRVTEIEPANTTELAEVKDDIRKDLALRKAADTIISLQETVEDLRAGGASLADAADQLGYKVRSVEAIDRTGRDTKEEVIKDLPSSQKLIAEVFQSAVGDQPSPIDVGTAGYAWYEVMEVIEPRDRTLDEVGEKVAKDWTTVEQSKLVQAKAEELKTRLENGENFADIATDVSGEVKTTKSMKRAGTDTDFPNSATLVGFAGDAKHVAIVDGEKPGNKILLKVVEIKGLEARAVKAPENLVTLANQGASEDLLNQLIVKLQGDYTVTQNPALIDQVLSRGY